MRSNDRFLVFGTVIVLVVLLLVVVETSWTQTPDPLGTVKTIQIDPTVVPNPDKVKESFAANSVRDILQDAFSRTHFEIGPSAVHAHIVLDEFTKGSQAKRTLVANSSIKHKARPSFRAAMTTSGWIFFLPSYQAI